MGGFALVIVVQVALFFCVVPEAKPLLKWLGEWLKSANAASWVQAFGSIAAVVGTWWATSHQVRKAREAELRRSAEESRARSNERFTRQMEESQKSYVEAQKVKTKAELITAFYIEDLIEILKNLKRIKHIPEGEVAKWTVFDKFPSTFYPRWGALVRSVKDEHLQAIYPLDYETALQIARGMGTLRTISSEIEDFQSGAGGWQHLEAPQRHMELTRILKAIENSHKLLDKAVAKLEKMMLALPAFAEAH